jgi:hypothetical protein
LHHAAPCRYRRCGRDTITFEERAVEVDAMAQRTEDVGARLPWYVFGQAVVLIDRNIGVLATDPNP